MHYFENIFKYNALYIKTKMIKVRVLNVWVLISLKNSLKPLFFLPYSNGY